MCFEICISVKWKKIDYNLVSFSVSTKLKKAIIMDEKRILLPRKLVII